MIAYFDEIDHQAVVLDIGTTALKFGNAGEMYPRYKTSTFLTTKTNPDNEGQKEHLFDKSYVGCSEQFTREALNKLQSSTLIDVDYRIKDFSTFEDYMRYFLEHKLYIEPSGHPILIADSACTVKGQRSRICEVLFERFNVPAVYFANNCILSSFSRGKTTSFVVDVAESSTIVAPIYEGYLLQKLMVRSPLSGRAIKNCVRSTLDRIDIDYVPTCLKQCIASPGTVTDFKGIYNGIIESELDAFCQTMLEVAPRSLHGEQDPSLSKFVPPSMRYQFCTSRNVHSFAEERFTIPEILFNPQTVANFADCSGKSSIFDSVSSYESMSSLPRLLAGSLDSAGADLRNMYINNVTLIGGVSLMRKFRQRLNSEVAKLCGGSPILKPEQMPPLMAQGGAAVSPIISPTLGGYSHDEILNASWIGGSMLGSMKQFNEMWTTKADYEEKKLREEDI